MPRAHGFTLIEVLIATFVLSGILLISLSFMSTMTDAASAEKRYALLLQSANRAAEGMRDALRTARMLTSPGAAALAFSRFGS